MRKFVPFVVVALILFVLVVINGRHSRGTVAAKSANAFDACVMAQLFVKDTLKAPATAHFAVCNEPDTVVTQNERIWIVRSWVDAENSFGAPLRNDYTARLTYAPANDKWTLVDLAMTGR